MIIGDYLFILNKKQSVRFTFNQTDIFFQKRLAPDLISSIMRDIT